MDVYVPISILYISWHRFKTDFKRYGAYNITADSEETRVSVRMIVAIDF